MAFTQANLDAVDAAIASGELTVSHNGRTVTYRSMADLKAARAMIVEDLAAQAAPNAARTYRFQFLTGRGD
ncbi:phage head-tail joining protein [Methylibium sp.]|uniref:phage head-tail joining protein n=1 Tax=Methylibium sp. TaxID=2067992 RepID=UPI003BA8E7D1